MRKCICNIFARQLPPSPNVTSQTLIYAFTKLHVSCFGFVKDRIYGSWFGLIFFEVRRIIVQLNSLRSHFFYYITSFKQICGQLWILWDTNVYRRVFSFLIGRSFDHIDEFQIRTHCLLFIWPLDLNHPQRWCANMAVGRGFFDQYSVFCVFGSVVGCVVVPLITQVKYWNRRSCLITL